MNTADGVVGSSGSGFVPGWRLWLVAMPLVSLPLFLGGARPWIWSPVAALFFIGLILPVWTDVSSCGFRISAKGWSLVLVLLLLYPLLQCTPLPVQWLDLLDPERVNWLRRSEIVTRATGGTVAVTYMPLTTLFSWFWWLFLAAYALLFQEVFQDKKNRDRLFHVLFGVAAFEAFYGLLQVLIPSLGVLLEAGGTGNARGTFVNRNHYADFLGMLWPILLAHLLTLTRERPREEKASYPEKERQKQQTQKQWFLALLIGLVLLAQFFSASRGGIISSLVALTVFVSFSGRSKRSTTLFIAACWLVMLVYGSLIGFDGILARFDTLEESAPGRFKIWEDTLRLTGDHFWTGTGLGTYETAIRLYQSHLTDQLQIGHAHNDYLELAAELGVPAAGAIVLLVWAYWWKTAYRLMKQRRSPSDPKTGGAPERSRSRRRASGLRAHEQHLLQAGALAGSAAFLCHGWVEFNWQIPSNQMVFVVLMVLMKGRAETAPQGGMPDGTIPSPARE